MKVVAKLKIRRMERDLTQYELGRRLGLGHAMISHFENYRCVPTEKQKIKLAKELKSTVNELFPDDVEQGNSKVIGFKGK